MIGTAHARCAGAGKTNCSVGISDEGWARLKEAEQQREQEGFIILGALGILVVVVCATFWWLVRTGKI